MRGQRMDFDFAVKTYRDNPCDEVLEEVAASLCGELKLHEKLSMLSGKRFFLRNGFDLITKGQKYNCRPCLAGGVKRLGIPEVAFSDGPRGPLSGLVSYFCIYHQMVFLSTIPGFFCHFWPFPVKKRLTGAADSHKMGTAKHERS